MLAASRAEPNQIQVPELNKVSKVGGRVSTRTITCRLSCEVSRSMNIDYHTMSNVFLNLLPHCFVVSMDKSYTPLVQFVPLSFFILLYLEIYHFFGLLMVDILKNKTEFCMLILYPKTLPDLFISS